MGLEAGEDAGGDAEGDFQQAVADPQGQGGGQAGEQGAAQEHHQALKAADLRGEFPAAAQAHARQKEGQAELPQGQVGAVRDRPQQPPGAAQCAQQQAHHEGAARHAQLESGAARQRKLNGSQQQPRREAQAEGQQVNLGEVLVRVSEELGDLGHAPGGCDDAYPVAQFQDGVAVGNDVPVTAAHAGNGRAETVVKVQFLEAAARHLGVRHEDAPEVQLAAVCFQRLGVLGAQHRDDLSHVGGRADHRDDVPGLEHVARFGKFHFPFVRDAPEQDGPAVFFHQVEQAAGLVFGHQDGLADQFLGGQVQVAGLVLVIHFEGFFQQENGEHHADDAHGVGDGVRDDRVAQALAGADGLNDPGQRGRIRECPGVQPGGLTGGQAQQFPDK